MIPLNTGFLYMQRNEIIELLFALRDEKYAKFNSSLIPDIDSSKVIGVRTPQLRKLAAELARPDTEDFMNQLPHEYFEENQLHAFLICGIRDYDEALEKLRRFLPYVNNWATCDQMEVKVFRKHTDELITEIRGWLKSDHPYTVRYGIKCLMSMYLNEHFKDEYYDLVLSADNNDYYVKMMKAWYFATALAKQYSSAVRILEEHRLDAWTHNKTIQKGIESYRLDDKQKAYIRTLKRSTDQS